MELKPEISAAFFAANCPQILKSILTSSEVIQPKLDDVLRNKILSDLFSQWLKRQVEQFQVEIDWKSKGLVVSNSDPQLLASS